MHFEYVPLLQIQLNLCQMPRGTERFDEYIKTLQGTEDDMDLPLSLFNPMSKQHVTELLSNYLKSNSENVAAQTTEQIQPSFSKQPGHFKVALVMADDAAGGWTNRFAVEFENRFADRAHHNRGWSVGILWSSEPVSAVTVRKTIIESITKSVWQTDHSQPITLRGMLQQLRFINSHTNIAPPDFPHDELSYTLDIIRPRLGSTVRADQIACLFGDHAAKELGYHALGLSRRAGFALAASNLPL